MSRRIHELFPTEAEAAADSTVVVADHLPVIFDVHVDEEGLGESFAILSWNILGHNAPSGFHKKSSDWETEEELNTRYTRIFQALREFSHTHHPDLIVLQEAQPALLAEFVADLLPDYELHDSGNGPAMLVRSKGTRPTKLKLVNTSYNRSVTFNKVDMQSLQTAEFTFNGHPVVVNNVHTNFYETPQHHEAFYRDLLTNVVPGATSVVVGDTNSRIAPKDDSKRQNITTGAVPMCINRRLEVDPDIQMTDFPDAAFVGGHGRPIRQLERKVLDYRNGAIFHPEPIAQEAMLPKFNRFRMLLCLDHFNSPSDRIEGKTVFEFETFLNGIFPRDEIVVRKAAKDNNDRGFAFAFENRKSPLFQFLRENLAEKFDQFPDEFQFLEYQNDPKHNESFLIFIHKDRMGEFLPLLNSQIISAGFENDLYEALPQSAKDSVDSIDAAIARLRLTRYNLFFTSGTDKIVMLRLLRKSVLENGHHKSIQEITTQWEQKIVAGRTIADIMGEKRNKLAKVRLSKKPAPEAKTKLALEQIKDPDFDMPRSFSCGKK